MNLRQQQTSCRVEASSSLRFDLRMGSSLGALVNKQWLVVAPLRSRENSVARDILRRAEATPPTCQTRFGVMMLSIRFEVKG
mmetsp:Transcript_13932/g.17529  ORF Transcript_13932/g.17529 Transcript_13932/m.17529 type:complete len:82 (-) Transcript_13932:287-532(-)